MLLTFSIKSNGNKETIDTFSGNNLIIILSGLLIILIKTSNCCSVNFLIDSLKVTLFGFILIIEWIFWIETTNSKSSDKFCFFIISVSTNSRLLRIDSGPET